MALSGEWSTPVGPYNELTLKWSATQSVANNTSTITAILYWGATRSGVGPVTASNTRTTNITIAGTTSTKYVNPTLAAGEVKEINRLVKTVTHNAQGTLAQSILSDYTPQVTLGGTPYNSTYRADGTAYLNSIQANNLRVWNGSAWVLGTPKVWNGTGWVAAKGMWVWDGSSWKT